MNGTRALNYTNHIVDWTMRGITYGYPPCCVGEFIIRCVKNELKHPKRKFHGTGYVPCVKCDTLSEQELLEYITANRDPELPIFPNDGEEF